MLTSNTVTPSSLQSVDNSLWQRYVEWHIIMQQDQHNIWACNYGICSYGFGINPITKKYRRFYLRTNLSKNTSNIQTMKATNSWISQQTFHRTEHPWQFKDESYAGLSSFWKFVRESRLVHYHSGTRCKIVCKTWSNETMHLREAPTVVLTTVRV